MSSPTPVNETPIQAETIVPAPANQVVLQINDIISAVEIIDTSAARGAFRGVELSAAGGVRDRLAEFVKQATKKPEVAPVEQAPEAAPAPAAKS